MKNNLQQLQELKQKLGEGDVEYLFRLDKLIQEAYNQGVKDSVEALPEPQYLPGTKLLLRNEDKVKHEYRQEAITNITKLMQ